MNRINSAVICTFFYCVVLAFPSCDVENLSVNNEISGKGTILKNFGDFLLKTDNGLLYVTTNLSDEFKVDKLRVEFRGIIHKNPNQNGIDKIELTYIKKMN